MRFDHRAQRFKLLHTFLPGSPGFPADAGRLVPGVADRIRHCALECPLDCSAVLEGAHRHVHEHGCVQRCQKQCCYIYSHVPSRIGNGRMRTSGFGRCCPRLWYGTPMVIRLRVALGLAPVFLLEKKCLLIPEQVWVFVLSHSDTKDHRAVLDLIAAFLPIAALFALLDPGQFTISNLSEFTHRCARSDASRGIQSSDYRIPSLRRSSIWHPAWRLWGLDRTHAGTQRQRRYCSGADLIS